MHYTHRKTKNIVDIQTQKYRDIISEITQPAISLDQYQYIKDEDKEQMISELTKYLHTEIPQTNSFNDLRIS